MESNSWHLVDPATGRPFKALIVDDSAFIVKQLSHILLSANIEVIDTAENGIVALAKYQTLKEANNVDFVTMDITMPHKDGISTLEEILNYDKTARVMMVSALGTSDAVKKSLILGAKGFIVKPFVRDAVLERISAILLPPQ